MSRCIYLAALTALYLCAAAPAAAQDPADKMAQIKGLNQEALSAFEGYNFKSARKKLEKAVSLARAAKLHKDPQLSPTLVLMGVAYVAGSNDLYRGLHYFVRALRLDSKAQIPKSLATPQLLKMFKTAQRTAKTVGNPPTIQVQEKVPRKDDGSNKVVKAKGRGLIHTPLDFAKPGYPVPVKAQVGVDIQANRLFLYYRKAGTVKFERLPMQQKKGVFRAAIPAKATWGRYLHYYIVATDQRGRLAASYGSAQSPNVVLFR